MTKDAKIIGINWCSDTIKRELPGDSEQFVEVRRLSKGEKLRRADLATRMTVKNGEMKDVSDMDISVATTAIKMFEYETCITDFAIKGPDKKDSKKIVIYRYGNAASNRDIYNHLTDDYAQFIDELIAEVNKDSAEDQAEVKAVEGN